MDDFTDNFMYILINNIKKLITRPDDEVLKKEIFKQIDFSPLATRDEGTGKTALIYAIENGFDDIATRILDNKNCSNTNINWIDKSGKTAFIYAVDKNKPEICKLIVEKIKYNLINQLTEQIENIKRTEEEDELSDLFSSKLSVKKTEDDLSDLLHSFGSVKIGKRKEEKLQEDIKNMVEGISWPEDLYDEVGLNKVDVYFFNKELSKEEVKPYELKNKDIILEPPKGDVVLPEKKKFKPAIVKKSPQKRKFRLKDRRSDYKKTIDTEAGRYKREQRSLEERKEKRVMCYSPK